jgi:hypothetical protein
VIYVPENMSLLMKKLPSFFEQLFRAAVSGDTNRELQERFQRGGVTISLYVIETF